MFKLLIVDDEPDITDSLYMKFKDLEDINLDVYKAYSAVEALSWLNRTKIDIVLTDIHMPGMNGLQLLEVIHKKWPRCKVVFLTGYNEFDYIYTASKYDGVSYLLKTEGYENILSEIEKVMKEIEKSLLLDKLLLKADEQIELSLPILQKDYLMDLMRGYKHDAALRARSFEDLRINMHPDKLVMLFIGRLDITDINICAQERAQIINSVKLIVEKHLLPNVIVIGFEYERYHIAYIAQHSQNDNGETSASIDESEASTILYITNTLATIQESCKLSLNVNLSVVVDNRLVSWEKIEQRFSLIKQVLYYRIGSGTTMQLIDVGMISEDGSGEFITTTDAQLARSYICKLEDSKIYIESGKKDEFIEILHKVLEYLKSIRSKNYNPALEIYYSISLMFLSYINKWNMTEKLAFRIGLNKLTRADEHACWEDAADYLMKLSEIIFDIQQHEEESRALATINSVKQYIFEHLSEDLSLVRLGEVVHFNPAYLSRLFKQETGCNLSAYITETRLKKAKELLEGSKYRINEIALNLGFLSVPYFTRVFKKAMNISPQEYRDRFHKK